MSHYSNVTTMSNILLHEEIIPNSLFSISYNNIKFVKEKAVLPKAEINRAPQMIPTQ